MCFYFFFFFFSSRRRHTRSLRDWSSDVCSSDLIEEPAPRTVWLLCAPSAEDLVPTIRSRCRVVTLVVPSSAAVARVLAERDGIDPARALAAARAAQGHIGRARRLALDASAAERRAEVLKVPSRATSLGPALSA